MVLYACKTCDFSSKRKSNYLKHLKSQKHLYFFPPKEYHTDKPKSPEVSQGITEVSQTITQKLPENLPKKYSCDFCDKEFSHSNNCYRHMKHYCKLKPIKKDIEPGSKVYNITDNKGNSSINNNSHNQTTNNKNKYITNNIEKNKFIVYNNISYTGHQMYKMSPIKFGNTFLKRMPSLDRLIKYIITSDITAEEIDEISLALSTGQTDFVSNSIDKLMKNRLKEMTSMSIDIPYLISNDGSNRRFVAKGESEWEFHQNSDKNLDQVICNICDNVVAGSDYKAIGLSLKDRKKVLRELKRRNDWNSSKTHLISKMLDLSVEEINTIEPDDEDDEDEDEYDEKEKGALVI